MMGETVDPNLELQHLAVQALNYRQQEEQRYQLEAQEQERVPLAKYIISN